MILLVIDEAEFWAWNKDIAKRLAASSERKVLRRSLGRGRGGLERMKIEESDILKN